LALFATADAAISTAEQKGMVISARFEFSSCFKITLQVLDFRLRGRFSIGGKEHEQKTLDAMAGFFFRQSKTCPEQSRRIQNLS
jgi:hypothetical protein